MIAPPDHEAHWKQLSKHGRIVAFELDAYDAACTLEIYEDGKRVLARDGTKTWSPKHPFERLAKVKSTDPKADWIRRVVARFTGSELAAMDHVTMTPYAARTADDDAVDVGKLVDELVRALAEPLPTGDDWIDLRWANRRFATIDKLHQVWALDRRRRRPGSPRC